MLVSSSTAASKQPVRPPTRLSANRKKLVAFLLLLAAALSVRVLTLQFMRTHLNDATWFQHGSYALFDSQARAILDGHQDLFWIRDPSRTDLVQYPPAFPWVVALIYKLTGNYSPYSVQLVVWSIDLVLSLLLLTGIAWSAFGWRAALASSLLAALSPLLAMYGAWPSADPPTTWFVLAGNWALLVAAKRSSIWFAFAAGLLLGVACWFRVNPLYLTFAWAFALAIFAKTTRRARMMMSAAVVLGSIVVIAPIVIRNYISFPDFTPTGGTIGTNLWEGLGETELGRNNGFFCADDKLLEHERGKMGLPPDFPLQLQWPDGIRRDRERVRESLAIIKQHRVWYAGVMLKRMWGMLKVAGEPAPFSASAGINVTSSKCLPQHWQGGVTGMAVNLLGMIQSVVRYLFLPLAAFGVFLALRSNPSVACILGITILYYLIPGSAAHTEVRYVLPMHGLLTVFAGLGISWFGWRNRNSWRGFSRTNSFAG